MNGGESTSFFLGFQLLIPDLVPFFSLADKFLVYFLSSIILIHSHPISFGSKKWKTAQIRSVQRIFIINIVDLIGGRSVKEFLCPSSPQELESWWAHSFLCLGPYGLSSLLSMCVSLFPISFILMDFSTQWVICPSAALGPTQSESMGTFLVHFLWKILGKDFYWLGLQSLGHWRREQHALIGKAWDCGPSVTRVRVLWLTIKNTRLVRKRSCQKRLKCY